VPSQRGYRDSCGIAHALDLVGERWALLVVRELLLGPKRFTDLRRALPAASPNALTDRLRELSDVGIVRRRKLPPPAASWIYELTSWGRELEPILIALGTWARRSSLLDATGHLSTDSVLLMIRSYFQPGPEPGPPATVEIRLRDQDGEERFGVWLDGSQADARHELPPGPDAVITADAATLTAAFGGPGALATALGSARIIVTGDRAAALRLIRGVTLPPVAPPEARI
jgi:DNA-binding HxlR family transcriptional regulator